MDYTMGVPLEANVNISTHPHPTQSQQRSVEECLMDCTMGVHLAKVNIPTHTATNRGG